MNRWVRKIFIALCVFYGVAARAQPSETETGPLVEIVHAEFGVFDTRDQKTVFSESSVVSRKQGQRYGWVIEIRTKKPSLSVREEYLLPNAANANSPEKASEGLILWERRSQVSQRQLTPVENLIYGEWVSGPNEPAGHRHLQVIIEDETVADFEFDVK
jgi:hypothetical protein